MEAQGSELYTTMEPCSVRLSGKKPCVESCIEAKVARVIIGVMEPNNFVQCEGVRLLREQGIQVDLLKGLEAECLAPNQHLQL